jgi:hypothetical protein
MCVVLMIVAGCRCHPQRLREGLHPRRDGILRGSGARGQREGRQGERAIAQRGQGVCDAGGRHCALQVQLKLKACVLFSDTTRQF